jgi:hypothetical protein
MATLNTYMQEVIRFLREERTDQFRLADLRDYINRARREVAMRSQCIRILPPISNQIITATVLNGGAGYTNPTVTIPPPDFPSGLPLSPNGAQATAAAILTGTTITAVDITYGGQGYFQPVPTITDPTGSGASVSLQVASISQLNQGQEVYQFSDVDLSMFPGVGSIYLIRSVSIIYSNYRYSLAIYDFSTYQAKIRSFAQTYQYAPYYGAQFGQGTGGSLYTYPLPSQAYQMEWDCSCLPTDLKTDQDYDAIPDPWSGAVSYYAAHLAYQALQNYNSARYYLEQFDQKMHRYRQYATPGHRTNPYGRPVWFLPLICGLLEFFIKGSGGLIS